MKNMKKFNVIIFEPNGKKFLSYDVMPYFMRCVEQDNEKLTTFNEYKKFIEAKSLYMYWSRCEWEIILVDWPNQRHEEKWDVHRQIMMNIDTVTEILMYNINNR